VPERRERRGEPGAEQVALEDGYREPTESWLALLCNLRERRVRAPVVAVVVPGTLGGVWVRPTPVRSRPRPPVLVEPEPRHAGAATRL